MRQARHRAFYGHGGGPEQRYWTKERIIDAIQRWTQTYGSPPAQGSWSPGQAKLRAPDHPVHQDVERYTKGDWPHANTVVAAFGSWAAAVRAAGYEPYRPRRAGTPTGTPAPTKKRRLPDRKRAPEPASTHPDSISAWLERLHA